MSHVDQMTVENLVEWEFEPRVLRVLEDAIRQAKRRNQSTFVRVNWPSESFDLLDAVNHGCTLRKRTFAWSDADDRRSFVALDVLEERETSGAVRFAQVGLWSSELRERVLEVALVEGGPQANLPLTVGGFAFAARDRAGSRIWRDWPDGLHWMPRWIVEERGGSVSVGVVVEVPPETTLGEIESSLRQEVTACTEMTREWRSQRQVRVVRDPAEITRRTDDEARSTFVASVNAAKGAIQAKDFRKVVMARDLEVAAKVGSQFDIGETLAALTRKFADCQIFCIGLEDGSVFLGATPEILIRRHAESVETVSLAGTAPRGQSEDEDAAYARELLASAKDRHEQEIVTETILSQLGEWSNEIDVPAQPTLRTLSNVQHLETRIRAQLERERPIQELVAGLHPTPAVGGMPSRSALTWLGQSEDLDRGWYAGPVGFSDLSGNGVYVVAIRSALLRGDRAWAFAGAGIVEASVAELEWDETDVKLKAVVEQLQTSRSRR